MILGAPDDPAERERLAHAIKRGARIVQYAYAGSFIVVSFRRYGKPTIVEVGADPRSGAWRYNARSALSACTGSMWGLIHAWEAYRINAAGGVDVTHQVAASLGIGDLPMPAPLAPLPEFNPDLDRYLPTASNVVLIILVVASWYLGTQRTGWALKDHLILAAIFSVLGTLTSIVVLLPFGILRGSSPLWQLRRGPAVFGITTLCLFTAIMAPRLFWH
jgi:hypothetical protein